jgi:C4-type Zn-finger protein
MSTDERAAIECPRCGHSAPRLVSLPFPVPFLRRQGVQGAVCENCLADLERQYSEDREGARPRPGPAAIEEPSPDDRNATEP